MVAIGYGCAFLLTLAAAVPPSKGESPKITPKLKVPARKTIVLAKPSKPKKVKSSKTGVDAVLARVQKHYENLKDYTADFTQTYTRVAMSRTTESRGTLKLMKPGMMRWDYVKPAPKLWLADGKQLFVYDPEYEQVLIDKNFEVSRLSNSISFLWGEGDLRKTFKASLGEPQKYKLSKSVQVLELVPKSDATYAKLVLVLDPKTGQVTESIIFETTGNTNHFKFTNLKINTGLKKPEFTFTPPPGTDVTYR